MNQFNHQAAVTGTSPWLRSTSFRRRTAGESSRRTSALLVLLSALLPLTLFGSVPARGQDFDTSGFGQTGDVFGGISFGELGEAKAEPVTWKAHYFAADGVGRLDVEATVGKSWHIYSTTQPSGGPLPTKISIASPKEVSMTGDVTPDEPPTKSVSDIYPGVTIEEHDGIVLWSAPIKVPAGFKGEIEVKVDALVCQNGGSCMPAKTTLTAAFAGPLEGLQDSGGGSVRAADTPAALKPAEELLADPASKPTTFRDEDYEVTWTAGVSRSISAGDRGQLVFRAQPEADFHVYKAVVDDEESSTNFVVTEKSGLLVGEPMTKQPVTSKSLFPSIPGLPPTPPVKYHNGQVAWSLPIKVSAGTKPGQYKIGGFVCYQACTDKSCLQPMALQFVATVNVGAETDPILGPIEIRSAKFREAIDKAAETKWVDDLEATTPAGTPSESTPPPSRDTRADGVDDAATPNVAPETSAETNTSETAAVDSTGGEPLAGDMPKASLPFILLLALAGGFILNFMPCVLPVIGIKVLSFVQQAGEDRGRVAMLNFAYVCGILSVFALLAVLAVVFSFGWGQQFAYFPVRIGLTVLIFALALSYLGVWELPTPGVATGKSSDELQKKEGLTGAFFTGTFATILATPCSGPFLGVALGYTLYLNSVESALVIMTVGLGMSLPYIVLGIFPSAVSILPKPGDWMVTLKEFMAFLFLGTVAFFFNQFSDGQKLPVFVTLIAVWFGCWIIGKVPPWESLYKRGRAWSMGIASAVIISWLGFYYLEAKTEPGDGGATQYVVDDHIRWEKYDEGQLQQYLAAGRTVMLDFTAEWCLSCKTNTAIALDTEPTGKLLAELDAVPMLADMTNWPEDIVNKIQTEFDSKSIPLLVVFPGESPDQPIILRDVVTQSMVLDALQQAGPSRDAATGTGKVNTAQRLTSTSTNMAAQNH